MVEIIEKTMQTDGSFSGKPQHAKNVDSFPAFFVCGTACLLCFVFCLFVCFGFSRQDFSVALGPVLERVLVDQAGLELRIRLPLPPKC